MPGDPEILSWRKKLWSSWLQKHRRGDVTGLKATLPHRGASQLLGPQRGCTWNSPGTTKSRPWWEHHVIELIAKGPACWCWDPELQRWDQERASVPPCPCPRSQSPGLFLTICPAESSIPRDSIQLALYPPHYPTPVSAPPGGAQAEDAW